MVDIKHESWLVMTQGLFECDLVPTMKIGGIDYDLLTPIQSKAQAFKGRQDFISLLFEKADKNKRIKPELLAKEAIEEFACATTGMSPAEIEAVIVASYDMRVTHVKNLLRIKALIDGGTEPKGLLEQDRKYWLRHEYETKDEGWEDDRATMFSLLEARNNLNYGNVT